LAQWYRGNRDKALELLEKAAKEHPGHPLNHLFYSQALWDEGDEASFIQYKTKFAFGEKLLSEGNWGYNERVLEKEIRRVSTGMWRNRSGATVTIGAGT